SSNRANVHRDTHAERKEPEPALLLCTRLEQLPEFRVVLQKLVLGDRQFAAEEKVLQRILAEDAPHIDDVAVALEVDAVVLHAIPIDLFPGARELPKFLIILLEIVREQLEAVDNFQLQLARQFRQFLGAHGIEDDLQHGLRIAEAHGSARQDLATSGWFVMSPSTPQPANFLISASRLTVHTKSFQPRL